MRISEETAQPKNSTHLRLNTPIQYLKGVGPKLAESFTDKGIYSLWDLIMYLPRVYQDQRAKKNISQLVIGERVSLVLTLHNTVSLKRGFRSSGIDILSFKDDLGNKLDVKFFRRPFKGYLNVYTKGSKVRVSGEVISYKGRTEIHHPNLELITEESLPSEDKILPIYTEIPGVPQTKLRHFVDQCIHQIQEWPEEIIPESLKEKYSWPSLRESLRILHQPLLEEFAPVWNESACPLIRRFAFEEFLLLELGMLGSKRNRNQSKISPFYWSFEDEKIYTQKIPFQLTQDQKAVISEIQKDLRSGHPMNRLLQGDVGSGKTIVALWSAVLTKLSGYQSALLVPTEVLAEQHYQKAKIFFEDEEIGFLTGSTKTKERSLILNNLLSGQIKILIGTHALFEDPVRFKNLALVIIDEQHRFGVDQRARILAKSQWKHCLSMSATPIPRTLAMTVYGDLDVSMIREKPPGRQPIVTRVVEASKTRNVMDYVHEQATKGRQVYIVYSLVEASEKLDAQNGINTEKGEESLLKDAESEFKLWKETYPDLNWGILHGRMNGEDKEETLQKFRQGQTQILVSTTVIEVGVDVPNASLMIIFNAERFGLSQLHQLRGRVGRGSAKSHCVLILGERVSREAHQRVAYLESSEDGFEIAEKDLDLRGPGEFMGTRQSGIESFRFAKLTSDRDLLMEAREYSEYVMNLDPELKKREHQALKRRLEFDQRIQWLQIK